MGAGCLGRIKAGTGAAGSSSTAAAGAGFLSAALKESKPRRARRRHLGIPGDLANHIRSIKIADDIMGADNNCDDFYDLEAKKLDGTTVSLKPCQSKSPISVF